MRDFRVARDVLDETNPDALVWRVIQPAFEAVSIYGGPASIDEQLASLTPGQRAILALHWTVSEVSNGGFDQYFMNPTGDLAFEARAGFERIGADRTAALVDRAFAAFPGGSVPRDTDRRARLLESLDDDRRDELFETVDEEFYSLMDSELYPRAVEYIRAHPAEFILD